MANPPCPQEDSIKYCKPKNHAQQAKGMPFFASIFSLIVYVYVFYIFNLSPYTLFNNHIFWFLMSNNLILIIAADYGAFSSSQKKQDDLHEQYHASSYVPIYQQVDKKCINPKQELGVEVLQKINKDIITKNIEVPERVIEVVPQNDLKIPGEYFNNEKKPLFPLQVDDSYRACEEKEKLIPDKIYRRSKSDTPRRNKGAIDESVNRMRRAATMKVEAKVEEESEFTTMTNDELNKRVEDFIQKFNRQIRLQATRDIYQI